MSPHERLRAIPQAPEGPHGIFKTSGESISKKSPEENEDMFWLGVHGRNLIFDGAGGHAGGRAAAISGITEAAETLSVDAAEDPDKEAALLASSLHEAHVAIKKNEKAGISTGLAYRTWKSAGTSYLAWASVGDSPLLVYIPGQGIQQVNRNHDKFSSHIEEGVSSQDSAAQRREVMAQLNTLWAATDPHEKMQRIAARLPHANQINVQQLPYLTTALGNKEAALEIDAGYMHLPDNAIIIAGSDGLENLSGPEICNIIERCRVDGVLDATRITNELIAAARAVSVDTSKPRHKFDDITIQVTALDSPDSAQHDQRLDVLRDIRFTDPNKLRTHLNRVIMGIYPDITQHSLEKVVWEISEIIKIKLDRPGASALDTYINERGDQRTIDSILTPLADTINGERIYIRNDIAPIIKDM